MQIDKNTGREDLIKELMVVVPKLSTVALRRVVIFAKSIREGGKKL
ncbi:hypothetical protein [Ruminiclostridium cellobioparum]|nr:hypothetical protein [Ruminiclostridium cellobioparum]